MSLSEMQSALARLASDKAYRKWFELDAEQSLAEYSLTPEEKSALRSIEHKMLGMFADTLRWKRRELIVPIFVTANEHFGDLVNKYFNRFYDLHPAKPHESSATQAVEFGRFLGDSLEGDVDAPPFASDLVRYETNTYMSRLAADPDGRLAGSPGEDRPGAVGAIHETDVPARGRGLVLQYFRFDVARIADRPASEVDPDCLADLESPHAIAWLPVAAKRSPRVFRLSRASAALIEMADGERTVADICREYARDDSPSDMRRRGEIHSELVNLCASGILGVMPGSARDGAAPDLSSRV